jgi:hypothetical protein
MRYSCQNGLVSPVFLTLLFRRWRELKVVKKLGSQKNTPIIKAKMEKLHRILWLGKCVLTTNITESFSIRVMSNVRKGSFFLF